MQATLNRGGPIKHFDLNLLVVLHMLLQTRSVSRAAQQLGISQPTVSRALSELRRQVGDPLLVRSGAAMTPTSRAVELARPLEKWLALTSSVLEPARFTPDQIKRVFRIAATDYGVLSVIAPVLPTIRHYAPDCRIEITPFTSDMVRKCAAGHLDLIVYGFAPDLSATHSRHLFRESQSVIVRADHPLARHHQDGPMPLDDYLRWPHIGISIGDPAVDHVHQCLGDRADERRVVARLPYFYAASDLIGTSDAILTIPTRAARQFATAQHFACLAAPAEIGGFDYWVLWHEHSARDPATLWLIEQLSLSSAAIDADRWVVQS